MSDDVLTSDSLSAPADKVALQQALTAGQILRRSREAQGLHIAALAVALKVPVKRLEAMEADRLEALPDAVFVRALASSICRSLKMDPGPVLALLPQVVPAAIHAEPGNGTRPRFRPSDARFVPQAAPVGRPVVMIVMALVVATLVLVSWPWLESVVPLTFLTGKGSAAEVASSRPSPVVVAPSVAPESTGPTPGASNTTVATLAPVPAVLAAVTPPVEPVAAPNQLVAATQASTGPAATAAAGAEGPALMLLKAKASVWIQVVDAKGTVLASKTLAAGEDLPVATGAPLSVVLGKVDAVDVLVRGKLFDAAALSKDNVARFEVK